MKKRYLCPVCDQELTARSYCPECRRIRREPVVYEGWLLPNESDQEGRFQKAALEAGGASRPKAGYGQDKRAASGKEGLAGRQVQSGRRYDSRYPDTCGSGHTHTYGVPNQDPHKKKRGAKKEESGGFFRLVRVLVIVILLVVAAVAFLEPVKMLAEEFVAGFEKGGGDFSEERAENLEDDGEESGLEEESGGDGTVILSEEEVVAAGEPCNGYGHYDMDGEEYLARLKEYAGELWPEEAFEARWQESDNRVYISGDNSYSYYKRSVQVFLENGVYYSMACDTATGEVMEISIGADAKETFGQAFLLAACALEPERDRTEVWKEIGELLLLSDEEEYYFGDWGIHEVYLSGGTSYYGSLTCLLEYDKYR